MNPEKMLEKIIRAKIKLENAKQQHSKNCVVEYDPEGYAPCNCGASKVNAVIDEVLRELNAPH